MEILDFIFGVILTICGVVIVEIFIEYIREKREIRKLLTSLVFEIAGNIDIANYNLKNLDKKIPDKHFPFKTQSILIFRQSILK